MPHILEAHGLTKAFGATAALSQVSLSLRAGEIHSLMGENGAGKSTLIKILSGIYKADTGEIRLKGDVVRPRSNYEAQSLGISTVFQEVNLIPTLSIAENIYLGREPKRFGFLQTSKMRLGAKAALGRLGLKLDVTLALEDYPIAIQQMVAIARALDLQAEVLILDEATSSLDRVEVEALFKVLRQLKAEGLAIVFISHFLDQIYEICDRVTVLRNGSLIGEWLLKDLPRTSLISKMMGRELEAFTDAPLSAVVAPEKVPWLECRKLGREGSIKPFDLELRGGELLGLAGLLGSGRTELVRLLFGEDKASEGEIILDGQPVRFMAPSDAIAKGFAMVPEDRKAQSIFPGLSVRENIVLALQARRGWARSLSRAEQDALATKFIGAMGIRTSDAEQPIETLSGGNQQKVILARWLALEPRLLLLDEPTRGIDVGAKTEILKLVRELSTNGKSVILVSSEIEEVVRVSDRVAVMKDHCKIAELVKSSLTESAIMTAIGEAR